MIQILFVDDEPRILEGIRRQFHGRRSQWAMQFATSGEAALSALAATRTDVIVSDVRMPGMDGTALLEKVRQHYPQTLRFVLSGHARGDLAQRAAAIAHQSFGKPCDTRVLEDAIDRALRLRSLLASEPLSRLVGRLDGLPTTPRIYTAVCQAFEDPRVTLDSIAELFAKEVALSAQVLKLANSAFLSVGPPVTSVRQAITLLGLNPLRALIVSSKLAAFRRPIPGFSIDALQRHSLLCAYIASDIVGDKAKAKEDAFAAGLLHDIGQLILASHLGEVFARTLTLAARNARPLLEVERERLGGVTHAELGAYLVGLWGLPYSIVEALALHHSPTQAASTTFDTLAAVYVANWLAEQHVSATGLSRGPIDIAFLERLGVHNRLAAWQAIAARRAAMVKAG